MVALNQATPEADKVREHAQSDDAKRDDRAFVARGHVVSGGSGGISIQYCGASTALFARQIL
jgi:hypothetical protein